MNQEEFAATAPGELVRSPEGAWAFVPAPLPPVLSASWELMNAVGESSGALQRLAGVAHTLPNENLLIRPFLRREAVLSSRIEGTVASLPRLFELEADETEELEPNFQEVTNYVWALDHGLERLATLPVSLPLLQEMHAILMHGVRGQNKAPGEFRRQSVWIGGANPFGARFVPPPPPEMMTALYDLEKYLHAPSPMPLLVRLALIHYQFESIHPFIDGNGQLGRLMLSLLLCSQEVLPRPLLYLSGYFERHRREYYDGLLNVSREGAWMEWVLFFLRAVRTQAHDAVWRAERLMDLREHLRGELGQQKATPATFRALDELFAFPSITVRGTQKQLDVSKRTAQIAVEKLLESGIVIEATGRQRNRIFSAPAIVEILDAPDRDE